MGDALGAGGDVDIDAAEGKDVGRIVGHGGFLHRILVLLAGRHGSGHGLTPGEQTDGVSSQRALG
ncbi:hypothetical protein Asbog_02627 [Asaia bogorensis NBRC 16594]|nr:hypothetical protein Asbog_02627 [Asaia bogorensis NBRC 16594]